MTSWVVPPKNPFFIHSTSIIDEPASHCKPAKIGAGTKIWHFCHIRAGAVIGQNCVIGDYVHVGKHVQIGAGCKIEDFCYLPEGVVLHPRVFVGPHVCFTNIDNPRAWIDRMDQVLKTTLQEGCTIGAGARIRAGITIGKYAVVAMGANVVKDVPPFHLVAGNPARILRMVDTNFTLKEKRR